MFFLNGQGHQPPREGSYICLDIDYGHESMVRELIGESEDFPEGVMKGITVGSKYLLVVRVEGALYAMDGRCSHMTSDLARGRLEGFLVTCRLHGAQFDIRTGERVRNMAARSMTTYRTAEEEGKVYIEFP